MLVGQSQEHHQGAHRGIPHQPLAFAINPIEEEEE